MRKKEEIHKVQSAIYSLLSEYLFTPRLHIVTGCPQECHGCLARFVSNSLCHTSESPTALFLYRKQSQSIRFCSAMLYFLKRLSHARCHNTKTISRWEVITRNNKKQDLVDTFYKVNLWVGYLLYGGEISWKGWDLTRHHFVVLLHWTRYALASVIIIVSLLYWTYTWQFGDN